MKKDRTGGQLLTQLNEGKSHEENPLGGVPLGDNNRAQEGETVVKDKNYVLSNEDNNRITKSDIDDLFLPKDLEGLTWAEASKKVNAALDESPNDPIIKRTVERTNDSLILGNERNRLAKEQAMANMQIPSEANELSEAPEVMEQQPMQGQPEQFYSGGNLNNPHDLTQVGLVPGQTRDASGLVKDQTVEGIKSVGEKIPGYGEIVAAANAVTGLGKSLGQSIGGDKGGNIATSILEPQTIELGLLKNKDATTLDKLSGYVPVLGGLTATRLADEARNKAMTNYSLKEQAQGSSTGYLKQGGYLKYYQGGGPIGDDEFNIKNLLAPLDSYGNEIRRSSPTINMPRPDLPGYEDFSPSDALGSTKTVPTDTAFAGREATDYTLPQDYTLDPNYVPDTSTGKTDLVESKYKAKGTHPLQYAGVLGQGLNYLEDRKRQAKGEILNTLGNTYDVRGVNEAQLTNLANQAMQNEMRGLSEIGLTPGQLASSMMGTQLNYTKGLSDAFLSAEGQNRAIDQARAQFNLGRDTTNLQQSNLQKEINAANLAAVENQKRMSRNAMFENLAALGKEGTYGRRIETASGGYDPMGRYNEPSSIEAFGSFLKSKGYSADEIANLIKGKKK